MTELTALPDAQRLDEEEIAKRLTTCPALPSLGSISQALRSKNSKNRLLKTIPAGSQWPHST